MQVDENYTGSVTQGGAAQRKHVPGATITKLSVGPMDNNAYLVVDDATGKSVLIDAAAESDRLTELLDDHAPELTLVVTTHQHADHWQALADVVGGTGAPTAAHALDAGPLPVPVDRELADGDHVEIGELVLDVIHLRGHTPGSVALLLRTAEGAHLFTGDSLFPGGPGKTGSAADFTSLMDDLEQRVFGALPDDTVVYPGHGRDTNLGVERPQLAEWRSRGW
ncbi:MBL fold metallo-hydrolase [Rhodococcus antarcticus]|jgi:glyoxylase-like metal-dependent hydrolase (beta-lactamase superfamily II)|uniref:MBL fold metallo-hydrolase n=1 Tax=Rhodococcus antarcticus TaxID=2987751 RepID=A0ABY6NVG1_9NOCA|nr:MBL fold metallo-hydrolase [Rhodococcus antarcticus]UZJ23380.1 MBL fold metallo-hydrolase [Rhodococcus antarcticus]